MRSGIDLHMHSPNFNLYADFHQSILVQRALNQRMARGYRQRLATRMRSGIDLHVHSPKFNLHADLHQSLSVQRAVNQRKWHQDISREELQQ